jgi:eukaryotic-like serine/threonine-protein kinase
MRDGLPESGDVIAEKYVVDHVLGRGGMGTVYAVTHVLTGKRLALKCLLPSYLNNPSVVERFLREARTAGRIQHRHVIDVFDAGREGDVLYIIMPLLEGRPLADLLHDERLTLEELLVILVRAMEGVAAAHDEGILHRDLKPGNIFVCLGISGRLDDPRVLDFGISKLQDEAHASLTRSGTAVGTPYYMPIEQLTGQRDLDQRVDVYALGVIMYEAIAGRPPHRADNVAALALQLMHSPPRHLTQLRPDLPAGLADVVMRALERERELRFPSIRALIEALIPFIPQSAGLTMPEPQGRPLRTPRDMDEPELGGRLAHGSATTAPSEPPGEQALAHAPSVPAPLPTRLQGSIGPNARDRNPRVRRVAATMAALGAALLLARFAAETPPEQPARGVLVPRTPEPLATRNEAGASDAAREAAVPLSPAQSSPPLAGSDAAAATSSAKSLPAMAERKRRGRQRASATPGEAAAPAAPELASAPSEDPDAGVTAPTEQGAKTVRDGGARPATPLPVDTVEEARGGDLAPEEF